MLGYWRKRGRAGPWIAMVAAYALALQALLGAVLISQTAAAGSDPSICFASEDGAPGGHDGGGKSQAHLTCALCTLAKGSHAILGAEIVISLDVAFFALRIVRATERAASFDSPTGQYQTGPPQGIFVG